MFRKSQSLYSTTSNSFGTGTGETITLSSVAGVPTDTDLVLTFDRDVAGKIERILGRISGSNFVIEERGVDGTSDQSHTSPTVEYIDNARDRDDIIDGILVEHGQTGAHDATKVAMLAGAQTVTGAKTFGAGLLKATSPQVTTGINDSSGNELIKVTAVGSAVNELTISNNATGSGPIISATGGDTNIDINLVPKGTGGVKTKKRVLSATNYTTDTGTSLNCDNLDTFIVTAQAGALKFNNPTGTPTDGQTLWLAVTGTGARALTYDTQFESSAGATLPTTTVTTARIDIAVVWRADTSKWHCVGVA